MAGFWVLAGLAGRMWTVPQMWLFGVFLSIPFLVLALRAQGKAGGMIAVCLAGGFSGFLGYRSAKTALDEGPVSKAIMTELGSEWIAHSIASAFLPLVLTAMILVLRRPWVRPDPR